MLSPTSMSAMSIERISNAVPASSPFSSTRLEIESGFSSTCLCVSAEPIALTMPSPTRAMIVSSVAPPTSRSMLVRTVTRAFTLSWMPFLATPSIVCRPWVGSGQSMTLGLTLVCTASSTFRPARSMAAARLYDSGMSARLAAIRARTTFGHVAAGQVVGLEAPGGHAVLLGQARLDRP